MINVWSVVEGGVEKPNQIVTSRHRQQQVEGTDRQLDTKSRKYDGLGRAGQVCCCDLESGGGFTLCDTLTLHY